MFFESADARCPERPTSWFFGLFTGYAYHDWELLSVEPWGPSSWYKYEVTAKCKLCGTRKGAFGINEGALVKAGVKLPPANTSNYRGY